jgi:hypothetical protein
MYQEHNSFIMALREAARHAHKLEQESVGLSIRIMIEEDWIKIRGDYLIPSGDRLCIQRVAFYNEIEDARFRVLIEQINYVVYSLEAEHEHRKARPLSASAQPSGREWSRTVDELFRLGGAPEGAITPRE